MEARTVRHAFWSGISIMPSAPMGLGEPFYYKSIILGSSSSYWRALGQFETLQRHPRSLRVGNDILERFLEARPVLHEHIGNVLTIVEGELEI